MANNHNVRIPLVFDNRVTPRHRIQTIGGLTNHQATAIAALQGILANRGVDDTTETPCSNAAEWAVEYADALWDLLEGVQR